VIILTSLLNDTILVSFNKEVRIMTKREKFVLVMLVILFTHAGYALGGDDAMDRNVFDALYKEATVKEEVKEISYEQFVKLRKSSEEYILFDVLLSDSYNNGHIEGARSFPVTTITRESAEEMLSKDSKIVVYCANFHCAASTNAARVLSGLGYKVLDYKGGLKEWQKKGNKLVQ
ncbi:rhodanese-like domain-containing protein, partial [Candidatus Omnitrophota bacterium]